MTTLELVNLMMKSSDNNPYGGKVSKENNIKGAIELAKLFKKFADDGQADEAMYVESDKWVEVINKLKEKETK